MEPVLGWLFIDYLAGIFESFVNPQKRVSLLYIFSALILVLVFSIIVSIKGRRSAIVANLATVVSSKIWFSKSSRADIYMLFINRAVMMGLSPLLLSRIAATTYLFFFFHETIGSYAGTLSYLPTWVAPVTYTVTLFIFDDMSRYLVHRAMHHFPPLWAFHKVHHSAEYLTPLTVLRTHPIEGVIFSLRSSIVQAVTIASFVFLFGEKIDLITVFGVNIFLFLFNISGANLRHSHFSLSYGTFWERIFISPAQHQIHHSIDVKHQNKNFGVVFSIWDRLGGSLFLAQKGEDLKFGVSGKSVFNSHNLGYLYLEPFKEAYKVALLSKFSILGRIMKLEFLSFFGKGLTQKNLFLLLAVGIITSWSVPLGAKELNIYSHRQPFLINPFLKAFEAETGIKTNVVFSSKGLAQRLLAEGKRSPADVVLTVDISRLNVYADKNLLTPINSKILESNIPAHLRDSKNRWFGLSKRARIIVASNDRVAAREISRIEDLSNPSWKGRICSRPGSHVYNRALLASIIAANGEAAAENWARGLVSNLAQRPQGNDRAQIKAIFQGVCDIAIVNSYYFGKLRFAKILEQREWTKGTRIIFTNQDDRGNHINISGAGVAKYSRNKEAAVKFLEFLSGPTAQKLYTEINYEFPGNPKVSLSPEQLSWGKFVEDKLPIGVIAELAPKAQIIIDRVGW